MQAVDPLSDAAFFQAVNLQGDAGDKSVRVRFFEEPVKDEAESTKAGHPVFRSVEFCEIHYGDKDNIVCDRVKYMHPDPRERFASAYAKFRAGDKEQVVGFPLREWGMLDRATAATYEACGILTVEQLSGISDTNAQKIRGAMADRQKAADFLAAAKGEAPLAQARAENLKMREELDAMKEQVAELKGLLDQATAPKKGKV